MHAPARPVRGAADLGTLGNQIDGGSFYISGRDQEGVAGQKLLRLLNGGRPDALLVQTLLQPRHLAENETQGGGVGIAFRVPGERERAPTGTHGSPKLFAA